MAFIRADDGVESQVPASLASYSQTRAADDIRSVMDALGSANTI